MADARRFGAGADALRLLGLRLSRDEEGAEPQFLGVMAVNLPVVIAFLSVAGQWRTVFTMTRSGLESRFLGLDYSAVVAGLSAAGILSTPALWAGIQVMEQAAIVSLNGLSQRMTGDRS